MKAKDIIQSPCGRLNPHLADPPEKKRSKYNNVKTEIDGQSFDSKREARRYIVLRAQQLTGEISNLRCQVTYDLGVCIYKADFVYDRDGETIVEDVKGYRTQTYLLKKKLMLERWGIEIKEI